MAKKPAFPRFVTDACTVAYGYLHKADTGGQYSDDKFKFTAVFDGEPQIGELVGGKAVPTTVEEICQKAIKMDGRKTIKGVRLFVTDGDDKANEEFHGKQLITPKSKFPPKLVGTDRQELDEDMKIYSGDVVKFSGTVIPYPPTGPIKGVAVQLRAVQLIEKKNMSDAADDFAGGDEDIDSAEDDVDVNDF